MNPSLTVGGDVQATVEALADELGRSVALVDPAIRPLYISRHFGDEDNARIRSMLQRDAGAEVVGHILAQGVTKWHGPRAVVGNEALGLKDRLCLALRGGGWLLGLLMIIDADQSLTPSEISRVAEVGRQVAAQLYAASVAADPDRAARQNALRSLLKRNAADRLSALEYFTEHGDGIDPDYVTVAVMQLGTSADTLAPIEVAVKNALDDLSQVRSRLSDFYLDNTQATLLLQTDQPIPPARLRDQVARAKAHLHTVLGPATTVTIGLGHAAGGKVNAWKARYRAVIAQRAAALLPSFEDGIASWDELGVDSILLQLPGDALEWSILPSQLRVLTERDHSGKLVETLRSYLDYGGSASRTASALHLHRTSLYYRLDQIREITGFDLDDGRDRLLLHVGMHLLDMLRGSGT
jgi:hypothetical protein